MLSRTMLRGGTVIDGTGSASVVADVLINGDRIEALAPDLGAPEDCRIIDVAGLTVTPGFIDLHSHGDFTLLAFPTADSAVRQGITTVATGNCGGGVAPINSAADMASVAFAVDPDWGVEIDWRSFGDYAARLDGASVNVAPLVAHGAIRNAVMGLDPRAAESHELVQLRELTARCLDEGAFGLSSGLEYLPGQWSDEREMRELVTEVGSRGRMYATHMRGRAQEHEAATAEALAVAHDTGARLQLSHFASRPNAPTAISDRAFGLVESAVADGEIVGVDTFPEVWGPALLIDLFPAWVFEGNEDDALARLANGRCRSELVEHFDETPSFLAKVAGYSEIYIADAPNNRGVTGSALTEIDAGRPIADVACDLLLEAGERFRSVAIRHIYATEPDLERTLNLPFCSIESDGVITRGEGFDCPLVWNASSYGYAPRVIEHYVRATGLFTLEEAVRRMTSLPAAALGLAHRGTISVGSFADIVVIDPAEVHDLTTPADPARHPSGMNMVFVNGELTVARDSHKGVRAGRQLHPL